MPELAETKWIECSGCKQWFHADTCIKVERKYVVVITTVWIQKYAVAIEQTIGNYFDDPKPLTGSLRCG